jgi:hypothetical protein
MHFDNRGGMHDKIVIKAPHMIYLVCEKFCRSVLSSYVHCAQQHHGRKNNVFYFHPINIRKRVLFVENLYLLRQ